MIQMAPRSKTRMTYNEAILNLFMCKHDNKKDWRLPTDDEYYWGNAYHIEESWYKSGGEDFGYDRYDFFLTPIRDIKFVYIPDITCYNKDILFNKRYR